MRIQCINAGFFKLDGGAMFGVVPKKIWQRQNTPDENNLCNWATRCMLIEVGKRLIIVDTGLGDKQSEKFFSYYDLNGDDSLKANIKKAGYDLSEVTDVVLTHLHFDHCGGAVSSDTSGKLFPTFPNAKYWLHSGQWQWANTPNKREKASFLKENFVPIQEYGQLHFIDKEHFDVDEIDFMFMDGHTEKQTLLEVQYKGHNLLYVADLVPSVAHIPIPYVMGYDVRPLQSMNEKEEVLSKALKQNSLLIFDHDPVNECCSLHQTEKGIRHKDILSVQDL